MFLRISLTHLGRWFAFTIKIPRDYVCSLTYNINCIYATKRYKNCDRKQVEESTSRFLLLIEKQLTNTSGIFLRAFLLFEQLNHCVGLFCPHHWEVKLRNLRRKTYEGQYVIRDKNQPTVLANSFNNSRARRHNKEFECKYSKQTCSW